MSESTITWLPIETAPTKPEPGMLLGPSILLACYGGVTPTVCEGHWRPHLPAGDNGREYQAGWVSSIDPDVWPQPYLDARYWAPRPQAPELPADGPELRIMMDLKERLNAATLACYAVTRTAYEDGSGDYVIRGDAHEACSAVVLSEHSRRSGAQTLDALLKATPEQNDV